MRSILVIATARLLREAMQIMLRAGGYDVTVAVDGKSGIEAIKSRPFDLAIVDLFMPDMNGLKVTEAVRQSNPTIPLIIASGFMFGGDCPPMPEFEAMATEVERIAEGQRFTTKLLSEARTTPAAIAPPAHVAAPAAPAMQPDGTVLSEAARRS